MLNNSKKIVGARPSYEGGSQDVSAALKYMLFWDQTFYVSYLEKVLLIVRDYGNTEEWQKAEKILEKISDRRDINKVIDLWTGGVVVAMDYADIALIRHYTNENQKPSQSDWFQVKSLSTLKSESAFRRQIT